MKRLIKKSWIILLVIFFLIGAPNFAQAKEEKDTLSVIEDIITWKKKESGVTNSDFLLNNQYLEQAGETVADWYPIGLGRIGYPDDYESYLAVIDNVVSKRYQKAEKLDKTKATEWHRISLAILAMGGDPTKMGSDGLINLIADGTYDRGKEISLGAQGLNGWIWGLITVDSMHYEIPDSAYYSRDDLIEEILKQQVADGGFSFYHDQTDPDMTGMALQALAPYYNSEQAYTYKQKVTNKTVTKTVRQVVDEALYALSAMQLDGGDFASWGMENAESVAQVLVALAALGIDVQEDPRFIKKGHTLIDGLLKYQMKDGGFIHSKTYNPDNPTSLPDESNSMASEQVLYAFISMYRQQNNYRNLYDFRPEMDDELKDEILDLQDEISKVSEHGDKSNVQKLFDRYLAIPISERSYVYNYYKLADRMKALNLPNTSESISQGMGVTTRGNGTITPIFNADSDVEMSTLFTAEDAEAVENIPKEFSTEFYVEIVKRIQQLESAENRSEYEHLLSILKEKKIALEKILVEIEDLNREILDKLYPFNELSIKDKENVEKVVERFEKLSEFDQMKVLNYEDVKKSKTQIDNLIRARMISIVVGAVIVLLLATIYWRMKKRKAKRKQEMDFEEDMD